MALKDCIRARAMASNADKFVHVPYRSSKLTVLMKDAFGIITIFTTLIRMILTCYFYNYRIGSYKDNKDSGDSPCLTLCH